MTTRITWNSKTLDFPRVATVYQPDLLHDVQRNVSISGRQETLNVRVNAIVAVEFRGLLTLNTTHATFKRNFKQFLLWAQAGNPWYFAWDSAENVLTTLTSVAALGASTLQLSSTTGVDANAFYVLRSEYNAELVKIQSVDSGVQVTLVETINAAYASGDRFRSERYWPAVLIDDGDPLQEDPDSPGYLFKVSFRFREDINDL